MASKTIPWKRIPHDAVDRYLNLLAVARAFCIRYNFDAEGFEALDLTLAELNQFSTEDASDVFETNLLQLVFQVSKILKTISRVNNYWYEIRLNPKQIIVYHSVDWQTGVPQINKRKKGTHPGSEFYEDALTIVLDIYGRVLDKQENHE